MKIKLLKFRIFLDLLIFGRRGLCLAVQNVLGTKERYKFEDWLDFRSMSSWGYLYPVSIWSIPKRMKLFNIYLEEDLYGRL